MIRRDGYVVWPVYFDRNVPRSRCRRVPLSLAVKNPTADDIVKAARSLGWSVEVEPGAHPSTWWNKSGKIVIKPDRPMSKNSLIKTLAHRLKLLSRP